MLTTKCKEIFILKLYELYIEKAQSISNKLKYGKKLCPCDKTNLILADWGIEILCNYESFDKKPQFIYSFSFLRTDSDSLNIDITVGLDTFGSLNSGNGNVFANIFNQQFLNSPNYNFETLVIDNTLYVWGTEPENTIPVIFVNQAIDRTNSVIVKDLSNDASAILDLINCITYEEFCSLKNKLFDLLNCNCNC